MKTETKVTHTPGPWTLGKNGDKCAKNHAICAGHTVLAKVYGSGYPAGEGWSPYSEAIARLISAAPMQNDLLVALEAYTWFALREWAIRYGVELPELGKCTYEETVQIALVAAIQKAGGQ